LVFPALKRVAKTASRVVDIVFVELTLKLATCPAAASIAEHNRKRKVEARTRIYIILFLGLSSYLDEYLPSK
jgi:hypothetical protein